MGAPAIAPVTFITAQVCAPHEAAYKSTVHAAAQRHRAVCSSPRRRGGNLASLPQTYKVCFRLQQF
jgi:hypothetical protein